ncbi:uncharacterized protein LOC135923376 isoform X1 [Gordionus sp. m RMFG-2023]|uniref:uncharacterized protein LOC135923376 isoform X1 n=2 Tax=Gordionus sp. m RMFG-2023 TaxID=3053472 RepID=UPI0031FE0D99
MDDEALKRRSKRNIKPPSYLGYEYMLTDGSKMICPLPEDDDITIIYSQPSSFNKTNKDFHLPNLSDEDLEILDLPPSINSTHPLTSNYHSTNNMSNIFDIFSSTAPVAIDGSNFASGINVTSLNPVFLHSNDHLEAMMRMTYPSTIMSLMTPSKDDNYRPDVTGIPPSPLSSDYARSYAPSIAAPSVTVNIYDGNLLPLHQEQTMLQHFQPPSAVMSMGADGIIHHHSECNALPTESLNTSPYSLYPVTSSVISAVADNLKKYNQTDIPPPPPDIRQMQQLQSFSEPETPSSMSYFRSPTALTSETNIYRFPSQQTIYNSVSHPIYNHISQPMINSFPYPHTANNQFSFPQTMHTINDNIRYQPTIINQLPFQHMVRQTQQVMGSNMTYFRSAGPPLISSGSYSMDSANITNNGDVAAESETSSLGSNGFASPEEENDSTLKEASKKVNRSQPPRQRPRQSLTPLRSTRNSGVPATYSSPSKTGPIKTSVSSSTPSVSPNPSKKKKKKDPNEPQKPVSAYALFFRDTQAAIKGQNPTATFGEVSKIVASMWDTLELERKDVYKKKTDLAKKEYIKKLAEYRNKMASKNKSNSSNSLSTSSILYSSTAISNSPALPDFAPFPPSSTATLTDADKEKAYIQKFTSIDDKEPNSRETQAKCLKGGCENAPISNPQWDSEYCGESCVVAHCKEMFSKWVYKRQNLAVDNNTLQLQSA